MSARPIPITEFDPTKLVAEIDPKSNNEYGTPVKFKYSGATYFTFKTGILYLKHGHHSQYKFEDEYASGKKKAADRKDLLSVGLEGKPAPEDPDEIDDEDYKAYVQFTKAYEDKALEEVKKVKSNTKEVSHNVRTTEKSLEEDSGVEKDYIGHLEYQQKYIKNEEDRNPDEFPQVTTLFRRQYPNGDIKTMTTEDHKAMAHGAHAVLVIAPTTGFIKTSGKVFNVRFRVTEELIIKPGQDSNRENRSAMATLDTSDLSQSSKYMRLMAENPQEEEEGGDPPQEPPQEQDE